MKIAVIVAFSFICYLTVGLAMVALFVHWVRGEFRVTDDEEGLFTLVFWHRCEYRARDPAPRRAERLAGGRLRLARQRR